MRRANQGLAYQARDTPAPRVLGDIDAVQARPLPLDRRHSGSDGLTGFNEQRPPRFDTHGTMLLIKMYRIVAGQAAQLPRCR